jgi:hypothetical protein
VDAFAGALALSQLYHKLSPLQIFVRRNGWHPGDYKLTSNFVLAAGRFSRKVSTPDFDPA